METAARTTSLKPEFMGREGVAGGGVICWLLTHAPFGADIRAPSRDRQLSERFFVSRPGKGTSALFRADFYSNVIVPACQGLTPLAINPRPIRGRHTCTESRLATRVEVFWTALPLGRLTWRPCRYPRVRQIWQRWLPGCPYCRRARVRCRRTRASRSCWPPSRTS